MMSSSSNKQQEGPKLFSSRILSRDRSSVANASFRVYYNSLGAGTVPFLWESKPGTPKSSVTPASASAAARTTMPPISPPPSYQQSAAVSQSNKAVKKFRRRWSASWPPGGWIIGLLNLNLNLNVRRRSAPSSPTDHQQQRCLARDDDHGVVVDGDERRPRRSTLCF